MTGKLFSSLLILLLLPCGAAHAERPGWNEPGRAPGYEQQNKLRINADYFQLAAATGGDFYFWAPGEFAASAGILKVPLSSEPVALLYSEDRGPIDQSMQIPIDAGISELTLFAGAQRLDRLRLIRPDGRDLEANPAGADIQSFKHMRIVTVSAPEAGLWRAELQGDGGFELAARYRAERRRLSELGLEAIDLIAFEFVELRGRPGHQGYFPIKGPPEAGAELRCRLALSGGVAPARVEAVSADGESLAVWPLAREAQGADDEFFGLCKTPEQPFRVRVRGTTASGESFQRITSGLLTPR